MTPFNINYKNKNYKANYKIDNGLISVYYDSFYKNTQLGGHSHNPELLAKIILREIIKDNNL